MLSYTAIKKPASESSEAGLIMFDQASIMNAW